MLTSPRHGRMSIVPPAEKADQILQLLQTIKIRDFVIFIHLEVCRNKAPAASGEIYSKIKAQSTCAIIATRWRELPQSQNSTAKAWQPFHKFGAADHICRGAQSLQAICRDAGPKLVVH
eukprot:1138194-Pelagomonas_calceolata.AAC.2